MAMVDEQHKEIMTLTSKMLAARAEYYGAYERCAALLVREFGIYKVTNGSIYYSRFRRLLTATTAQQQLWLLLQTTLLS